MIWLRFYTFNILVLLLTYSSKKKHFCVGQPGEYRYYRYVSSVSKSFQILVHTLPHCSFPLRPVRIYIWLTNARLDFFSCHSITDCLISFTKKEQSWLTERLKLRWMVSSYSNAPRRWIKMRCVTYTLMPRH